MALAIVRQSDGRVQTFVRDDVPEGWTPPEGFDAIPESELPEGWQRIEDESQVTVPESITKYQAIKWLRDMGLYESLMAMLSQDQDTYDRWEYGPALLRSDPIVVGLGLQLGLTTEQLDAAFTQASQIQ